MGIRRPKKHHQNVPEANMQCVPCKKGNCVGCVNATLFVLDRPPVCPCKKNAHTQGLIEDE